MDMCAYRLVISADLDTDLESTGWFVFHNDTQSDCISPIPTCKDAFV